MAVEDTKEQVIESYSIRQSKLAAVWLICLRFLNGLLNFFSLKKNRQFWGIVYDSVSKQPLDPVIVKLLYADGREIETGVTDIAGRYGFLAQPGKFKIFVRKTNYLFPSKYVTGDFDGIYENLYHGEFFELYEDLEVVAPNIPMDPAHFDWNQKAKTQVIKIHAYWQLFLKKLMVVFFWFGFLFVLLGIWRFYRLFPAYLYLVLGVYVVLIISAKVLPEERLWGQIVFNKQARQTEGLLLELHSFQFSNISFGKTVVRADGKFLLRAGKGRYLFSVSRVSNNGQKELLCSMPVEIGKNGVLNRTFFLTEANVL